MPTWRQATVHDEIARDGFHPSPHGYRAWVLQVGGDIRNRLTTAPSAHAPEPT